MLKLGKCRGGFFLFPVVNFCSFCFLQESTSTKTGLSCIETQVDDVGGTEGEGRTTSETYEGWREQAEGREEEDCCYRTDMMVRLLSPLVPWFAYCEFRTNSDANITGLGGIAVIFLTVLPRSTNKGKPRFFIVRNGCVC
jgi:hypothetical protein